jgi:predicted nucleotidyltransferase
VEDSARTGVRMEIRGLSPKAREKLPAICRRYGVRSLDLFGSALTERFDPERSDIDVVVDLGEVPREGYADAYFGLRSALEKLFARPVDLITQRSIENPYLRAEIDKTRMRLFPE